MLEAFLEETRTHSSSALPVKPAGSKGSATYAQYYRLVGEDGRKTSMVFTSSGIASADAAPPYPSAAPPEGAVFGVAAAGLEDKELLPRVLNMLSRLLGAVESEVQGRRAILYMGVAFVDTHDFPYLNGTAPDITIVQEGCRVDASTALAVIELQVRMQGVP